MFLRLNYVKVVVKMNCFSECAKQTGAREAGTHYFYESKKKKKIHVRAKLILFIGSD